jgi:hypothetical protein
MEKIERRKQKVYSVSVIKTDRGWQWVLADGFRSFVYHETADLAWDAGTAVVNGLREKEGR